MAVSQDLMLALLSLDSYNRGYGFGIEIPGTTIGLATWTTDSTDQLGLLSTQLTGFYASAYTLNGQTIISYRGTNADGVLPALQDIAFGWITGAGVGALQSLQAAQFYTAVTGNSLHDGASANTILTGHSLGGGLAGYVSALTGTEAVGFDHMPFGAAAWLDHLAFLTNSSRTTEQNPIFSSFRGINTAGEALEYVRSGALPLSIAVVAFLTGNPMLAAAGVTVATSISQFEGMIASQTVLPVTGSSNPINLHSMSLLAILQYAKDTLLNQDPNDDALLWVHAQNALIPAFFSETVGAAAKDGFTIDGVYSDAAKMLSAIAYSAIDEGTRVFGDAGIRAMFDDANNLGKTISLSNASTTVVQAAGALSEILMQFAGQLAFGKVLQTVSGSTNGVLALDANNTVLTVDFNDALWSIGRNGTPPPTIFGRDSMIDTALGLEKSSGTSDLRSGFEWLYGSSTSIIDRIAFNTTNDASTAIIPNRAIASTKATLYVAGGGNDTITGSVDRDIIYGGDGDDILRGKAGPDLLAGGAGNDRLAGGTARNFLAGGTGFDTAFYEGVTAGQSLDVSVVNVLGNPVLDLRGVGIVDRMIDIEKVELSNFADTLKFASQPAALGFNLYFDGGTQSSGQDKLDFSTSTSRIFLGNPDRSWFGFGAPTDSTEMYSGVSYANSWIEFLRDLITQDGDESSSLGLVGATGIQFQNFENVVGSAQDDVLGLWRLNPGGALSEQQEAQWHDVLGMVTYDSTIDGQEQRLQEKILAGQQITQNLINVTVNGGFGDDVIVGTRTGNVTINGGDGNDRLVAGGFTSTLYGGVGDDVLYGGGVKSVLDGGAGADSFVLTQGTSVFNADADDVAYWGPLKLTGGVQQWWQESGFAYWSPLGALVSNLGIASIAGGGFLTMMASLVDVLAMCFARYAINGNGDLVVQMAGGIFGQAVIKNYQFNLDGASTANIEVFSIQRSTDWTISSFKKFLEKTIKQGSGLSVAGTDPLVIDLDGDGLELTRQDLGTYFDIDSDGFAEHTAWVGSDDGLLSRDINGNGKIDNQSELFGNATMSGFAALSALDSNGDGIISAADTAFASLRVWRDLNNNGITDAGELTTLSAQGIASISLASFVPATTSAAGNTITAQSTVTLTNGQTRVIADTVLDNSQIDTKYLGDSTVAANVASLGVKLKGYGNLKNLDVAMTSDATLFNMVSSFDSLASTTNWATLKGNADDILFRWAGVSGVAATAMTSGFDRQKLAFLEAFSGQQLVPRDTNGIPLLTNVRELIAMWDDVLDRMTFKLAAQGPLSGIFANPTLDLSNDAFKATSESTLSTVYSNVLSQLSTNAITAIDQWKTHWAPILGEYGDALVRSNGVAVRTDFEVASLVRAMTQTATVLTLKQLVDGLGLERVVIGTSGADALTAVSDIETNVFVGDSGNDTMTGGFDQDTYVFGTGFGQDTIVEKGGSGQSGDRVRLATLNAADVTFSRVGNDLVITVNNSTDKITIQNQYLAPTIFIASSQSQLDNGIEDIQFADGTIYEWQEIAAAVGKGTSASETITGTIRSDILEAKAGDDTMLGGDNGDFYIYNKGDGVDIINDVMTSTYLNAADMLGLVGGLLREDVIFSRSGANSDGDDLILSFAGIAGSITITNQFKYTETGYNGQFSLNNRIEAIFFSGGDSMSWNDVQQTILTQQATDGDDIIYGFGNANTFAASAGNDQFFGLDGGDTYNFGRGSGQDIINDDAEYDFGFAASTYGTQNDFLVPDVVSFGADILPSDIVFSRTPGTDDLVISITGTADTLTVHGQFYAYNVPFLFGSTTFGQVWADRIESFKFANGTVLTWQDVLAKVTTGTAGNDHLTGAFFADTLDGKGGDDVLSGREEGDSYLFGVGDGQDTIEDNNSDPQSVGKDAVVFKAGVTVTDVIFSIAGTAGDDLLVKINGTSDQILIKDQFHRLDGFIFGEINKGLIEEFRWHDGTTKTWAEVLSQALQSQKTAGNDAILGTNFDDTLDGGAGNDSLAGDDGADTYVFGLGYGQDTVWDNLTDPAFSGSGDRVLFNADTLASQVTVLRGANESIILSINGTSDTLTLLDAYAYNEFYLRHHEIEKVEFATGTIWTSAELRAKAMLSQATSGADTIRGFYTSDILAGGTGNDILKGGDGSDIYRFNVGDGQDRIEEGMSVLSYSSNDILELGSGFTSSNIVLSRPVSSNDLLISFSGYSDTTTIKDQFKSVTVNSSNSLTTVEAIKFSDGTVWTQEFMRQKILLDSKTSGNDVITGFLTDDTIDGGAGNDVLRGMNGNDTYLFGIGSGQDVVEEPEMLSSKRTDTVQFGAGISTSGVTFSRLSNDLKIVLNGTADVLTIKDHFLDDVSWGFYKRVEAFKFADGTTLSYQDVNMLLAMPTGDGASINGTVAADTISGTSASDIIAGRGGNDIINSAAGSDRFLYASGDGSDTINETSTVLSETDTLDLSDLNVSDVLLSRVGTSLVVRTVATGQTITVTGQFASLVTSAGIEELKFSDGTVWSRTDISEQALVRGTSGTETIVGDALNSGYDTGAGGDAVNDLLGGSDRYYWRAGDGSDFFKDVGTVTDTDSLLLRDLYYDDVLLTRLGNDLRITNLSNGEVLTILAQFAFTGTNANKSGIETLTFADGRELSRTDLLNVTPVQGTIGTTVDDTMYGLMGTPETLSGGSGNDTYFFSRGAGQDTVSDAVAQGSHLTSNEDTLQFAAGISIDDLQISRVGNDVILKIAGTNDQITLDEQLRLGLTSLQYRIEYIKFADGTQLTASQLDQLVVNAQTTSGDDIVLGAEGDDIFFGKAGNDTYTGYSGSDTYLFQRGMGQDTIVESDRNSPGTVDVISFAAGIASSEIELSRVNDDLILKLVGSSDQMTVSQMFKPGVDVVFYGIELFKFADGTVWTSDAVKQMLIDQSLTSGDDTIVGYEDSEEILDGGAGNDILVGKGDRDTYVFGLGYGQDTIDEQSGILAQDKVLFKESIRPDDLIFSRVGNNLEMSVAGTLDKLTIVNQFSSQLSLVEYFEFADGTKWSEADVKVLMLSAWATVGNDSIVGFAYDDEIYGLDGNDVLNGGQGQDILIGGAGADQLIGGGETSDTASYVTSAGVTINMTLTTQVGTGDENGDTFSGIENVTGSAFVDQITGNNSANILNGMAGNDTLNGGSGNDKIIGGAGADNLTGGAGTDTLSYEGSDTGVSVNLLTQTASGGHAAGDVINAGFENILGSSFDDFLTGNSAANTITGGTGDDTLDGGAGTDILVGGWGNDTYVIDALTDVVTESTYEPGIDTVRTSITGYTLAANVENLVLLGSVADGIGNSGHNVLTGNSSANTLTGADGEDTLDGGSGNDTMIGGNHNDTYYVDSVLDVVTEASGTLSGTDLIYASVALTLAANVENLTLVGTASSGTGNAQANTIIGNASNNSLSGMDGNDILDGGAGADAMTGGAGNDTFIIENIGDTTLEVAAGGTDTVLSSIGWTLTSEIEQLTLTGSGAINGTGNSLANVLTGNAANNILNGGTGVDKLVGGQGDDTYIVEVAGETTTELADQGNDLVISTVTWTLASNVERLTLNGTSAINGSGNSATNILTGNSAANVLDGKAGADILIGLGGNDTYIIDDVGDVTTEITGGGVDIVQASISWVLANEVENLTLTGSAAINGDGNDLGNFLAGNTGNNYLLGLGGNDTISAGAGADLVNGGAGADVMTGSTGSDRFVFAFGDSGQTTAFDQVTDFAKGASGVGDVFDFSVAMTVGGSAATASATQAAINTSTGVATFAASSGTTLSDALGDIASRFTAATDAAGEFALFRVNATGSSYLFVSDGVAGVGANDVVVQLSNLTSATSIGSISLNSGDLAILT